MASVIGAIFFIVGSICTISTIAQKIKCSEVTKGVVVDISREVTTHHDDYPNKTTSGYYNNYNVSKSVNLFPIVEYTVGDQKYVKKSNISSNVTFVGKEVEVHYDPENPDKSYFGKNMSAIVIGVVFMIIGAVVFTVR